MVNYNKDNKNATVKASMTWDLDSLFERQELKKALKTLSQDIEQFQMHMNETSFPLECAISQLQNLEMQEQDIHSFISCLIAQDVSDQEVIQFENQISSLRSQIETLSGQLNALLIALPEAEFEKLLEHAEMKPLAFVIRERREWAKGKLSPSQERLINRLSIDGYQAWERLYEKLMGQTVIPFEEQKLSVGQAESRLSHPEPSVRKTIFQQWEKTWQEQEHLFAHLLNHLGGFRLQTYEERGWTSMLKEPLFYNRMRAETLDTMWHVIENSKGPLLSYLKKKAQLLNLGQLSWVDIDAPLSTKASSLMPFEEAADLIVTQFSEFSSRMGHFAKMAFERRWIEAEDRPGKLPGGFCSPHPQSKESRIFMTYSGTPMNVFTLAHELGHAYHNEVVKDLPILLQQYRMNVAETASTLAEMIVVDSMFKRTQNLQEKQDLLDKKLHRAVLFLMNIHARFLFENRFYQRRHKGLLTADELSQLMEAAQKEAFHNALAEWHPRFWISKRHFYITEVPFYNFPYTFGYLFSLGIYAVSLKEGKTFEKRYDSLLMDTGRMDVETLAQMHLGVDLTQPAFWQSAIDLIHEDVKLYLNL